MTLRTAGVEFMASTTAMRKPVKPGGVSVDSTGGIFTSDMMVGADGVYSVVRRFVAPDLPAAGYAGYMLWRGLVPEAEVPGGLGDRGRNLEIHAAPGPQLVVYGT